MPARNKRFFKLIPAGALPDKWRYYIEIFPVHSDPYDGSETAEELPDRFIEKLPVIDEEVESENAVASGAWNGGVASVEVNLGPILESDLFDYLTDDGQPLRYALTANTVWKISTDMGNAEADLENFQPLFIGVQRDYVGNDITGDQPNDLTMSIDLVDIGKVCFESIPIWESGNGPYLSDPVRSYYTLEDLIRSRVEHMGGTSDTYGNHIRDRAFELIYLDEDENLYCVVHIELDHRHEYVFIKWRDVIGAVKELVAEMLDLILRAGTSIVNFRWMPDVFAGIGFMTDAVTLHEQAFTEDAAAGSALSFQEWYILAWVRQRTGHHEWSDQQIYGGAIWGKNVVSAEYTNLWDWYKDLAENCGVRAAFSYAQVDGVVALSANATTIYSSTWESEPELGNKPLATKPKFSRGGNASRIASAISNIADPQGKSESEFKRPVASSPQSLKQYNTRFALHTNPIRTDDADHYWIRTPASTSEHSQATTYDTDFSVSGKKIIAATSGVNLQCFYYFPTPDFYVGSEPGIAVRVSHKVTIDTGGLSGDYSLPEGTEIPLPTWDRLGFPDGGSTRGDRKVARDTWLSAIRTALLEIGRRGWPAYIAHLQAKLLGRGELRKTVVSVRRRDLHFANQGPLQIVKFHVSDLIPVSSDTKPHALLTSLKQDIGEGVDEVTLFSYYSGS